MHKVELFHEKKCIKNTNQTEAVNMRSNVQKQTVTPECSLKKKGLFYPCSPFSVEYARCHLKVELKITSHILTNVTLVAEIFNQLNNPILI